MVKTKELIICIISIVMLILTITTSVSATNGTQDVEVLLGGSGIESEIESGMESMASYKLQTFNYRFTMFEGDSKKGSDIKDVFNTVAASNTSDIEHKVKITLTIGTGAAATTKYYPADSGETECSAADISMTGKYKVTCEYDEEGYINQITIEENEEIQEIGGGNKNTNNTTNNTTNTMPDTGVEGNVSIIIIAVAGLSAIYAYKKIKEYNI